MKAVEVVIEIDRVVCLSNDVKKQIGQSERPRAFVRILISHKIMQSTGDV